jgi:hypothetical protein
MRYEITITPEGHDPAPVAIRLRRWLKAGLRSFGLRVLSVRETPSRQAEPSGEPPPCCGCGRDCVLSDDGVTYRCNHPDCDCYIPRTRTAGMTGRRIK